MQRTQHIIMIRPAAFRMNEETAGNNYYQRVLDGLNPEEVMEKALGEFDAMVELLTQNGVQVYVVEDDPETDTPDALFPNNWVTFHSDGRVGLYPMFAKNRRAERRESILSDLANERGFTISEVVDFTEFEQHDAFLEGTGSMVLDRLNRKAYAAISPRTDYGALDQFCSAFDYEGIVFTASQSVEDHREPIYHTNVMMSVGSAFAAVCFDSLDDDEERDLLRSSLEDDGKEIIELTESQISCFAGNMLEVSGSNGSPIIVLSHSAFEALTVDQRISLERHGKLLHPILDTIEACGGGSARCMMAEIHLPLSAK